MTAGPGRFRHRLRINTAEALAEGASTDEVLADVVSVLRGHSMPDREDLATAEVFASHVARGLDLDYGPDGPRPAAAGS